MIYKILHRKLKIVSDIVNRVELRFSGKVSSSFHTIDTCRVTLLTNQMICVMKVKVYRVTRS